MQQHKKVKHDFPAKSGSEDVIELMATGLMSH